MANWLGQTLFGHDLPVTTDIANLGPGDLVFNYSTQELRPPFFRMVPAGLLFEKEIRPVEPLLIPGRGWPVFFESGGPMGFDLLSAVFYLISRYEEYLPHEKDMYGRYAHTNSLAFRQGFLNRPLVEEWMESLKQTLQLTFPGLVFTQNPFSYLPTYDLDMAWSYRQKGWLRNGAALAKELLGGHWKAAKRRLQTLAGGWQDPFDVFNDLEHLHDQHGLTPVYFFLLAEKNRAYDKNILPKKAALQELVKKLAGRYKTGLHGSWQSYQKPPLLKREGELFTRLTGQTVTDNRMHYLKFDLPETYRQLMQQLPLLQREYSLGYGSINGYRASTCKPFYWYDLREECATTLQIIPFVFMEANSIFEEKQSPEEALEHLQHYHNQVKKYGGTLVTIFHNHLIGYDDAGRPWWNMYRRFLEENF